MSASLSTRFKVLWGGLQDDFKIDVKLPVQKRLIKKTLLGNYLKIN